jgi:hypothetical protein
MNCVCNLNRNVGSEHEKRSPGITVSKGGHILAKICSSVIVYMYLLINRLPYQLCGIVDRSLRNFLGILLSKIV